MPLPSHKEVFHLAGNQPDPTGGSLHGGVIAKHDLTAGALGFPQVWTPYKAKDGTHLIIEPDVYEDHILIICPVCLLAERGQHGLYIRASEKDFEYEPLGKVPPFPGWTADEIQVSFPHGIGGRLNVEPFSCTWESVGELRRGFGLQRCELKVSIRNNVMVPA